MTNLYVEYRSLQSESHPDISSDAIKSSNINRAYTTLKNPYTRIAHFIHLKLPNHVNITDDAVAKTNQELPAKVNGSVNEL